MIKKSLVFVLAVLALCHAANFTTTHGKLKVSGGKILNKSDQEVVLRGMSLYWYNGPWGGGQPGNQFYTQQVVSDLANDWGASLVRAAIGNVQQNPNDALGMAKNMMDWANNAGIYVIIDNHSHTAHNETQNVQNFFSEVSKYAKEKNYTHVIYELYNEPQQGTTWAQIKTFAQAVIPTIRSNDPDGLIVVGTPAMSSSIGVAKSDPLTGTNAHNVLYTLHFYAGETGHNLYKDALRGVYCADVPIFVTEWGTSPASGNGTISTSNGNSWISLLESAKISHANWSLSNTNETSAALYGTSITSNLTASGTYVKNLMKLNSGSSLSNVGLTAQTIDCSSSQEPAGPDGRIEFGYAGSLVNFASKSGADSVNATGGWALANTSANFTADYTLINIPKAGTYVIAVSLASTASGTVSWSGSGIESGQVQFQSTGSLDTFKYTERQKLVINQAPETPLRLTFQTSSANSLRARYVYTALADSADSVKLGISTTPVQKLTKGKTWNYNAATKAFSFEENEGTLSIVNLRGEKLQLFAAKGTVYLKGLPTGVYIAIYKRGSEISKKTVYLK